MSNNAWMCRPNPDGKDRFEEFYNQGIIAIGWPGYGDLTGKSKSDLKQLMSKDYQSQKLGIVYGTINYFVNDMAIGDFVLAPRDNEILVGKVTSDYIYDKTKDNHQEGYPHQRRMKWLRKISRDDLPEGLRASLRPQRTVVTLTHQIQEIDALAKNQQTSNAMVKVPYRLRPNVDVVLIVPQDITKDEAARVGDFAKTVFYA